MSDQEIQTIGDKDIQLGGERRLVPEDSSGSEPELGGDKRVEYLYPRLLAEIQAAEADYQQVGDTAFLLGQTNDEGLVAMIEQIENLQVNVDGDDRQGLKQQVVALVGRGSDRAQVKLAAIDSLVLSLDRGAGGVELEDFLGNVGRVVDLGLNDSIKDPELIRRVIEIFEQYAFDESLSVRLDGRERHRLGEWAINRQFFCWVQRLASLSDDARVLKAARKFYRGMIEFYRDRRVRGDEWYTMLYMTEVVSYPGWSLFKDEEVLKEVISEVGEYVVERETSRVHRGFKRAGNDVFGLELLRIRDAHRDKPEIVALVESYLRRAGFNFHDLGEGV